MDTNSNQDSPQARIDAIALDIRSVLAGSSLMRMINEGHVSPDVLNVPVRAVRASEMASEPSLQAA